MKTIIQIAALITKFELWIILAIAPFLLFPGGTLPFICAWIVAFVWVSRKITTGHFSTPTHLDIPIVFLVLTILMGYWISIDREMSWARMWNYLLGVIIFYTLVNKLRPDVHWQGIAIITCLLTIGIVLFSLVATDWSNVRLFQIPWLYDRFPSLLRNIPGSGVPQVSDLINARWIGITLGFLLPFLIPFLAFQSGGKFRLVLAITIAIAFLDLLLTQSVQGLAGLIVSGVFIAAWRNRKWALVPLVGLLAAIGLMVGLGAQKTLVYLLSTNNPVGIAVALRLDMWSRAAAMIRDMPFTGIGVNIFSVVQTNFYPGYIIGPEPHAHNLYLQTALDQGIPGLCAMLFMFVAWGIALRRNYIRAAVTGHKVLYIGLAAAILSYLTQGFLDGMTLGAKPAPILWAFLGIGMAPGLTPFLSVDPTRIRKYAWLRRFAPILLIAGIVGTILVFDPGAVFRNLGSYFTQTSLYRNNPSSGLAIDQMQEGRDNLMKAIELNPDNSHLYIDVSRLDSWLGNDPGAVAYLSKAVILDSASPFREYFPPEYLIRTIQSRGNPAANWDDLLQIYAHWMDRFPERAEGYLLCSLVSMQGKRDLKGAITYLSAGIEKQAEPSGLLLNYLTYLKNLPSE